MLAQITRRFFVKGAGLLSASAALAACSNSSDDQATVAAETDAKTNESGTSPLLAIIHTNDSHGHDNEVKATDTSAGNFSMAAVPALKKEWEDKGYDVLVLDAGDATQGTPLVDTSKGTAAITFMNSCGYDLMCVGNHEFDHGDAQIQMFEEAAEFPIISANIITKETGKLRFTPNKVFELMDGTKVGIFGLTTPTTLTTAMPAYTAPFTFLSDDALVTCAQEQVDDLRAQGADLVICLGHLGNQESCLPNTSKSILANVKGIDLFIDGHDHELVEDEVDGTLLVETGCYMANIGLVVIDAGVPDNQCLAYGEFDGIDTATQAIIDDVQAQVDRELGVILAATPFDLVGDKMTVRSQETNLADLICDAALYDAQQLYGPDVVACVVNAGTIRSSLKAGDITLEDVKTVSPFSNRMVVVRVTGAQLLEIMEASCQNVGYEGEIGAFPQVAGIELSVNATVPYEKGELYPNSSYASPAAPGARVTIYTVGGADFDEDKVYNIVVPEFLAQGGDTYYQFLVAAEKEDVLPCSFDYETIVSYLIGPLDHEIPERYRESQGRIKIITE